MNDNNVGFEEMHITKRPDGKGFTLKAKGIWNGEPFTIDIPNMQQPNLNILKEYGNHSSFLYGNLHSSASLEFQANLKTEDGIYYSVTKGLEEDANHGEVNKNRPTTGAGPREEG